MFVNSKSSSTRKRSWEWGQWGPREAILTPQQKVNKFILNDWSSESRDKGCPAEPGCSRVMGCIHSSVVAGMLEKLKVGLGGRNSTCSVPWLILPHCDNYCPETENCSFLGPLLANFMEEGKHGRGRREKGDRVSRESFSALSKARLTSASLAGLHLCWQVYCFTRGYKLCNHHWVESTTLFTKQH